MITIGITGGVGCGKSKVLEYIRDNYNCRIILADDIGNKVKEPGECCYQPMIDLFGEDIIDKNNPDGNFDKQAIARKIFSDQSLLLKINDIIHPAVKEYFLNEKEIETQKGEIDFLFLEAALLIECGYNQYVDEMWYIFAEESVRRERLKVSRNYSDEKIDSIMKSQLSEEKFRANSDFVIDNTGDLEDTYKQIERKMSQFDITNNNL